MKKFPAVEEHVFKTLNVRREIFTQKLSDIRRKKFLAKSAIEQRRPAARKPIKLLKSSVYFLNMISKKPSERKMLDTLGDETTKSRNPSISSALSWARASMTPKSGIIGALKNLRKSEDGSDKKKVEPRLSNQVDSKQVRIKKKSFI